MTSDTDRTATGRPARDLAGGLAWLADVLVVGLLVAVTALPVVTAYVATAAGVLALRKRAERGSGVTVGRYLRAFWAVARSSPWPYAVVPVLAALALAELTAVASGLPGARLMGPALVVALALVVAVLLRTAAQWRPGMSWPAAAESALARVRADPGGTLLLLAATLVVGLLAVSVPLLLPLLPGLPAFAAVAVEARARRRAQPR
ncbi:hypothetical protein [Micromonospora sp. 067-2]|uniref:hypothetical protein n=1 Tax=Micromonospora sp. 067-2 TaxID=2789270 RepID=UPI003979F039